LGSEAGGSSGPVENAAAQRGREADRRFNQSREAISVGSSDGGRGRDGFGIGGAPKFKTLRAALENVEQPLLAGIVDIELVFAGRSGDRNWREAPSGRRVPLQIGDGIEGGLAERGDFLFSLARSRGREAATPGASSVSVAASRVRSAGRNCLRLS